MAGQLAVARHSGILLGRCNPYGAESGGPRRVLGGLYGPRSAETPDAGLPENVAQGEWSCPNAAQVRARMRCRCDHVGQVMPLCSWHDVVSFRGEPKAGGGFRQVRQMVRVRGHFEEIQKRQSGLCPRCSFPNVPGGEDYGALQKAIQVWQGELALLYLQRKFHSAPAHRIRQAIEDAVKTFENGRAQGLIHVCPLTLEAVA